MLLLLRLLAAVAPAPLERKSGSSKMFRAFNYLLGLTSFNQSINQPPI
jgi:hypothetical protein